MSSNILNQSPYLRNSRNFPEDPQALSVELSRSYIEISTKVNERSIGIFPTTKPIITGDSYFLTNNQRQQSLRQIYPFTAAGSIPHGVNTNNINGFSRAYGWFTDGATPPNWYGAIYGSNVAIAGQISFYITGTINLANLGNIVVLAGAGAPAIVSGVIVVEWLSNS